MLTQHIEKHILTTSIQNWRFTRRRFFTNTIQHLHCRHTTTQSTSSSHGLGRCHHYHIYTLKHECSQEIHTTILNPDKTTCTLFTPDPAEYKSNLNLKIYNTALCLAPRPRVLSLTLDAKLTQATTNEKNTHSNRMG